MRLPKNAAATSARAEALEANRSSKLAAAMRILKTKVGRGPDFALKNREKSKDFIHQNITPRLNSAHSTQYCSKGDIHSTNPATPRDTTATAANNNNAKGRQPRGRD